MQQTSAVDHYAGQHILRWLRTKGVLISILIFVFVAGCATEPKKPLSIEERVRVETALGAELSRDFETKLVFREDMELSVYLRKVAERLTAATPEFVGITKRIQGPFGGIIPFPGTGFTLRQVF